MPRNSERKISVLTAGPAMRASATPTEIPVRKLAAEVKAFLADVGDMLSEANESPPRGVKLTRVEVTASIEMGGRLSLLGSGVETKGAAGITFQFEISSGGS